MRIDRIDHLVLTVRDVERTREFYRRVLGMEAVTFGEGRTALRFGAQKINLHPLVNEIALKAEWPTPGSADLCFVTSRPLAAWLEHLRECGVDALTGPVRRAGALGPIDSVYLRDPDGNLIEISTYADDIEAG